MNEDKKLPYVVGGVGNKKSNGGTQYFQQDRVYMMTDIALCLPSELPGGSYRYLVEEDDRKNDRKNDSGRTW